MSKRNHARYRYFPLVLIVTWLSATLLWITACQGVLDVQIEQLPATPIPVLGRVAYITGGDVWMVDLDSSQHTRLTRDGRNSHPHWSADGQWIAYLKRDELWINKVATNEEQKVSEFPIYAFAWSPQKSYLAYISAAEGLAVWDHSTQTTQNLVAPDTARTITALSWHPDGHRLAFQTDGLTPGLHQVALDGADSLVIYLASDAQSTPHLGSWSPDGRQLLAWLGPRSAPYKADGLPLCLLPVTGGEPHCLEDRILLWPDFITWSPLNEIALIVGMGRETWVNKGLAVIDLETLAVRWLVNSAEQAALQPAWSPQGERIIYSAGLPTSPEMAYTQRNTALAQRHIWIVEIASGQRRQLTGDHRYRDERPLWSSDGQHVLFVRLSETEASLWLMSTEGRTLQQVVSELTPRPDPVGEYGYIEWSALWDWWRPD